VLLQSRHFKDGATEHGQEGRPWNLYGRDEWPVSRRIDQETGLEEFAGSLSLFWATMTDHAAVHKFVGDGQLAIGASAQMHRLHRKNHEP
jgi:hypothetical protein